MAAVDELRDVTHRWMQGWNDKDADLLTSLVTDDLVYYDPAWPELMHGPAGVRAFTSACWSAMPDMAFTEPYGFCRRPAPAPSGPA